MARHIYNLDFALDTTINLTNVNGGACGNFDVSIELNPLNPNLTEDVQAALNALGMGAIFEVLYESGHLGILTQCTACVLASITAGGDVIPFLESAEECTSAVVSGTLTFDCNDMSCFKFKDTTKEYNNPDNLGGYGGPNTPEIADIVGTSFWITDLVNNKVYIRRFPVVVNDDYLPNAAGTSEICLIPGAFKTPAVTPQTFSPVPGRQYVLSYGVYDASGPADAGMAVQFTWPCCGSTIASGIGINYSILEKIGCQSIVFTDTTGDYNADTNPGGYGDPNPSWDAITGTLIKITRYDGTVINITDFIPTATNPSRTITNTELGYPDTAIYPQVMTIEYIVYTVAGCTIGHKVQKNLFHCALNSCIRGKGISLLSECGTCKDDAKATQQVFELIQRYEYMLIAGNGNIDCIEKEVGILYERCKKDCPEC